MNEEPHNTNNNDSVVKDYKTTPKMVERPINKGIENGVVSVGDYTKEYTLDP